MMADYIKRTEALILAMNAGARAIENTKRYHGASYTRDAFSADSKTIPYLEAARVLREASDAPAADVAEVVHGRWISFLDGDHIMPERYYRCSRCGRVESRRQPYCHCGAKMDGGADHEDRQD